MFKNRRKIFNSRGVTLVQLLVTISIIITLTSAGVIAAISINKNREETAITSNISQLETAEKSYYSIESTYATLTEPTLKSFHENDVRHLVHLKLVEILKFSDEVITNRFKLVDQDTLVSKSYLSNKIDDIDYYMIDTRTGKVYYLKRDLSPKEIEDLVNRIIADAGDITELNVIGEIDVEVNGKRMTKILSTASSDGKLLVGGDGDIKVAVINITENKDGVKSDIIDLTPKLRATAQAVTELRVVSSTKVVVHYYDGKELVYQTISF